MADVLSCYGPDLDPLADASGPVGLDTDAWEAWFAGQWRSFADAIGFRPEADQLIHTAIVTKGQFGSIKTVLVTGLADWIEKQPKPVHPDSPTRGKIDKIRAQAIEAWRASIPGLWTVDAAPDNVPGRGCAGAYRAFSSPNARTYYDDRRGDTFTPRGSCEWTAPLRVHLALWPWYTGANVGVAAPGLAWRKSGDDSPVYQAARVMQAPWTQEGNTAIRGDLVYQSYVYFRTATAPLIGGLAAKPSRPGELYRDPAGFLRVYLRDPKGETLRGPLGPVALVAYNQVLGRFASFFALRRALLSNVKTLPASIRTILEANVDPCVKKFVGSTKDVQTLEG